VMAWGTYAATKPLHLEATSAGKRLQMADW